MNKNRNKSLIGVKPTETLAKLYESQNHLLKSLAIYLYLLNEEGKESVKINLNNVFAKIIKNEEHFDGRIISIFNKRDLINFKIMGNDTYRDLSQSYEEIFEREKFPDEIEVEENEGELSPSNIFGSDLDKFNQEKKKAAAKEKTAVNTVNDQKQKNEASKWEEYSVAEFFQMLLQFVDEDQRVDELKIKDLLKIFRNMNK